MLNANDSSTAATWHHIVITTGGFRQVSVEVLVASWRCLSGITKTRTNVLFQCLSRAFL